jgi:hypothetical protein
MFIFYVFQIIVAIIAGVGMFAINIHNPPEPAARRILFNFFLTIIAKRTFS